VSLKRSPKRDRRPRTPSLARTDLEPDITPLHRGFAQEVHSPPTDPPKVHLFSLNNVRRNMNLRIWLLLVVGLLTARANPISSYQIWPPYVMAGENVYFGITPKGAVVTGVYTFRVSPDADKGYRAPYPLRFDLPIPVPRGWSGSDAREIVRPRLRFRGREFAPDDHVQFWVEDKLPSSARLAAFYFSLDEAFEGKEVQITIQYTPPFVEGDGADCAMYLPYLPWWEKYEKSMGLRTSSLLVTFEAFDGVQLRLQGSLSQVVQNEPRLIAVRPHHRELVRVEVLRPNNKECAEHRDRASVENQTPLARRR
jgi:hypothetical protein